MLKQIRKWKKKLAYECHHLGAYKIMDISIKQDTAPKPFGEKKRQKRTKPGNFRFIFDSILNRKVWVLRQPDKRGRDEVAAIDLEYCLETTKGTDGVVDISSLTN